MPASEAFLCTRCERGMFVPDASGVWCSFCGYGREGEYHLCEVGHVQEVEVSAYKDRRVSPKGQCGVVVGSNADNSRRLCLASVLEPTESVFDEDGPPMPDLARFQAAGQSGALLPSLKERRKEKKRAERCA